jgi:excisionase family DNA binding protein
MHKRLNTTLEDALLDVNGAAEFLCLKIRTLYTWANQGKIASVKIGGALRFKRSDLLKLIADSERPAKFPPSRRDEEGDLE